MVYSALKQIAVAFLEHAAEGRARAEAMRFLAPDFVHHNVHLAANGKALLEAMDENARRYPGKQFSLKRVIQDDNFVLTHGEVGLTPDSPRISVMHLFRFERDTIAELWDVAQEIPTDSPNQLGAF